ncbi:MAG: MFS transporter [Acidimicrobiales bacterium]
MTRLVVRTATDASGLDALLQPRTGVVLERLAGDGRFEAAEGPVTGYARTVHVDPVTDGQVMVTERIEFRPAVSYFGWLFVAPLRHTIRRGGAGTPWWAPPARLDDRAASVLGSLALLSVIFGYLNTLFTQTITFAGEEFGAGNSAQGVAGSVVRVGGILALLVMTTADRRGRRRVVLTAALAGSLLAMTGAFSTSLAQLTVSQMLARGFASALLVVVTIIAAEEVPAGSRAYAVSLLAMAGGLGAGICVIALRLADLGPAGWRLLYLIPALALPALASVRHRLPESRRFVAPHASAEISGHGGRLLLLAVSGLLANLFVAPQSQFGNRFLRTERGFSGGRIGLFSVVVGTPAAIGIVVGGHLADVKGRRIVAAVALVAGTLCTLSFFFATGWTVWILALVGNMASAAAIPALGVYGPELFPTSLRGRANGVVTATALAGSAAGLVAAGVLADRFGSIGPAMAILGLGPLLLAGLVLAAYPETAGRELEELNPEDRPPSG